MKLVSIKQVNPLYRDNEPAHSIELLEFNSLNCTVVVPKSKYKVGDVVLYIPPGIYLPCNELFHSFINPTISDCRLGARNRVKEVSFNFKFLHKEKVYSTGIVISLDSIKKYLLERYVPYKVENMPLYELYWRLGFDSINDSSVRNSL
jgi:hypothetical protein